MEFKKYQQNNYAYIDGANLHKGITSFGWMLDYARSKDLCSILLKRTGASIAYLNDQKSILQIRKEKAPDTDGTV